MLVESESSLADGRLESRVAAVDEVLRELSLAEKLGQDADPADTTGAAGGASNVTIQAVDAGDPADTTGAAGGAPPARLSPDAAGRSRDTRAAAVRPSAPDTAPDDAGQSPDARPA
jgi:hypothetical protein